MFLWVEVVPLLMLSSKQVKNHFLLFRGTLALTVRVIWTAYTRMIGAVTSLKIACPVYC